MRTFLALFSLLLSASLGAHAAEDTPLPLDEFEGLYEYEYDTTLIIVAGPERKLLYADINGARYPLRPHRQDVFLNAGDVEVEFVRGENGAVIGYRQGQTDGELFARLDADLRLPRSIWRAKPADAPSPYAYRKPQQLEDSLPVAALAETNALRRQLSALTDAVYSGTYPGVHSVLVAHKGALVFEEYFYDQGINTPHQLRSATKTIMALVAGIAVDKGLISSVNVPVLPFFPEYDNLKNMDARKRAITIKDLLTMQSGLACNDWDGDSPGNESKMAYADDWVRFALDLPMAHEPGTVGAYCSANVSVLGRIIEKATGKPLLAFAKETLFMPLGFGDHDWDFRPDRSNINNFTQAWLRSRDLIKLGLLVANDGVWNGQQVISADWIQALKTEQSTIGGTPYGYYYWLRYLNWNGKRVDLPQISGNGGQKVISLNGGDTVLVLTGGNYNQQTKTNEIVATYVLPGLQE